MSTCLGCGSPLVKPSQQVYCSNACHRARLRREATEEWLRTGQVVIRAEPRHFVRLYLLEQQKDCCALCGQARMWQGTALTLVLDHIDGDSTNNRRENLRLVCPNCDSQLSTYKSRNRGRGRHSRRQRYAEGRSF